MAENCAAKVEIARCLDRDIHMSEISRELTPVYRRQSGDEVSTGRGSDRVSATQPEIARRNPVATASGTALVLHVDAWTQRQRFKSIHVRFSHHGIIRAHWCRLGPSVGAGARTIRSYRCHGFSSGISYPHWASW